MLSIERQTFQNWECIIVNDGSPDNTEEIAKMKCAQNPKFKYIFKENGGLSSARNFGIQQSVGEFLLTLDADDKFEESYLEKAVWELDNNAALGIISCWGYRFIGNRNINIFKPDGKDIKDYLFQNAAIGNALFRKLCWEQVGGYDENMKKGYEDWDFYIRISALEWKTFVIQEALFYYRQREDSMRVIALNSFDSQIKAYIFKKNKRIYKEYYDEIIDHFLNAIDFQKKERNKLQQKPEYKIGYYILMPLRKIKSFFN
jgi:glycosyltransferase involved in cell wall biosynthesis